VGRSALGRTHRLAALSGFVLLVSLALVASPSSQTDWTAHIRTERDVPVRMRDGVTLYADVYRPDRPGRFPALLMRTPYDKTEALQSARHAMTTEAARRGYVVVVQDVRGRYASQGRLTPYVQEVDDGYDTIEWVAALPYVNGKVGTFGLSYPGAVQWMAATARPPHLVAMSPAMVFSNANHFIHYGGVFDSTWVDWLLGYQEHDRRALGLPLGSEKELDDALARDGDRWRLFLPLADLPVMKPFAYWREWVENPPESAYWAPFNIDAQHGLVQAPALNLTGWNDDGYAQPGAIGNFVGMRRNGGSDAARRGQRLIIGPWTHGASPLGRTVHNGIDYGPDAAVDFVALQLRFFDFWLRDVDDGYSSGPPVRLFVMGDNVWRDEQEWPLARTRYEPLFLRSGGRLSLEAPGEEPPDRFQYDPRRALRLPAPDNSGARDWREFLGRRDLLTYETAPLARDTEITGQILATLWLSTSVRDTDVSVKIFDVDEDGKAVSLASGPGLLRARYRTTEGRVQAPKPLVPGEAVELTVSVGYTSFVVRAGHRVKVSVGGSVLPDVHLNTWEPFRSMGQAVVADNTVHHDRTRPSRIVLPVIPMVPIIPIVP
jgi:putative CocE/NonD family hydrolase